MADLPQNSFEIHSREEWRHWLETNHLTSAGVWLVTYKKGSSGANVEYGATVEEALCFGWVDSLPRKLDTERSMLYFAARKPRTGWSRLNKERIERLIELGEMAPAGLEKVMAAKADGSWTKLDEVENLVVPEDLRRALADFSAATTHFDAFPRSVKRGILEWILNAKRPETRAKRVEETARLAQDNRRANQWRQ